MGKGQILPNLGLYLASWLFENVGGAQRLRRLAGFQNKRIAFPDNMSQCERQQTQMNYSVKKNMRWQQYLEQTPTRLPHNANGYVHRIHLQTCRLRDAEALMCSV
jgi:hypothetical protein